MASSSSCQRFSPQVTVNIIGSDQNLNQNIAQHLQVAIQQTGCTSVIRKKIPLDDVSWSNHTNLDLCIQKLNKKWRKVKDQITKRNDIQDFLINVQTVEHLSAVTSLMKTAALNRKEDAKTSQVFRKMAQAERREKGVVYATEEVYSEQSHLRIRLFVLKHGELDELDSLLEQMSKMTCGKRRVVYRDGIDRPGEIWSQLYGLLCGEPACSDLLQAWVFDQSLAERKRRAVFRSVMQSQK